MTDSKNHDVSEKELQFNSMEAIQLPFHPSQKVPLHTEPIFYSGESLGQGRIKWLLMAGSGVQHIGVGETKAILQGPR